ncbi:hypothetical protein D3C73_793300 [compost metagenome]
MRSVFVIGDSISIEYGPYLQQMTEGTVNYDRKQGEAESLIDLDQALGANGGDSSRVLAYLEAEKDRGVSYDILLINCGLHDIKTDPQSGQRQIELEQYGLNLNRIANLAAEMSNLFIWIRTTDAVEHIHNTLMKSFYRFHADVVAYNQVADEIMQAKQIPLIDIYSFTQNLGEDTYRDHVHFKDEVKQLQAAYLTGCIAHVVNLKIPRD